jgi:serine/threonine protein phosphatase PrpC
MLEDGQIARLLAANAGPGRKVDALIDAANGHGGLDNITAIVIEVVAIDAGADG